MAKRKHNHALILALYNKGEGLSYRQIALQLGIGNRCTVAGIISNAKHKRRRLGRHDYHKKPLEPPKLKAGLPDRFYHPIWEP